jgi:hypothetical protein
MNGPRFERIHVSLLNVDPIVQRATDPIRCAAMAKKFDLDATGVLTVNQRSDGKYFVVDGAHRRGAAIAAEYDGKLNCIVHDELPTHREAALFLSLNESKLVSAIDKFRIRVLARDEDATTINDIIEHYGWHVASGTSTGCFAAVAAIEKVQNGSGVLNGERKYDHLVGSSLQCITQAWGHNYAGAHAAIIGGLGQLFARFGGDIDHVKLTAEMAKVRPVEMVAKAKQIKDGQGGTISAAMAKVLVGLHNKGRRTNRLPDWRWTR